jgi:hypothetical protein
MMRRAPKGFKATAGSLVFLKGRLRRGVRLSFLPFKTSQLFAMAMSRPKAQLQKSRVEADVGNTEYARLKTLFEQNQNISEKSLQSAGGHSASE